MSTDINPKNIFWNNAGDELHKDNIISSVFDKQVVSVVANAVAEAAKKNQDGHEIKQSVISCQLSASIDYPG